MTRDGRVQNENEIESKRIAKEIDPFGETSLNWPRC